MGKPKKTRRSKSTPYVGLEHSVFYSPAFRAMSSTGRSLLWELVGRFNGHNNGEFYLSVRDAERLLGLGSDAAVTRAFKEVQEHGFAFPTAAGSFTRKVRHATTWRLTFRSTKDGGATREYQLWRPTPGSKAEKRLIALSGSNLRSDFAGLTALIRRSDKTKSAFDMASTAPQIEAAIVQKAQDCTFATAPENGAHILYHLTATRRRGAPEECKRIRDRAIRCLGARPGRTQRQLAALANIGESRLSRFLNDRTGRRTLDIDSLDRLAGALGRMAVLDRSSTD